MKNDIVKSRALTESEITGLAAGLAAVMEPPLMIYLEGDLGAGKTTFTRALIHSLGYTGSVKSPTYGLMEQYRTKRMQIVHIDLYRIAQEGELEFLGFEDLSNLKTVFMIEWPERGGKYLPKPDLSIRLIHENDFRILEFLAHTSRARPLCNKLDDMLNTLSS